MRKIFSLLVLSALSTPSLSSAHVKWFAEEVEYIPSYKWTDELTLWWIGIALVLIAIGILLEKNLGVPEKLKQALEKYKSPVLSIVSIGFGLAFVIFSINGFVFAPNLTASGSIGAVMITLQSILGVMMLLGFYERLGGLLLLVLFGLGITEYGAVEMLDTLEMVGFAMYAIIMGREKWRIADFYPLERFTLKWKDYAVPILRVATGLNLIVLGFTEKILSPSLTHDFLTQHSWNFMQALGFESFSNYYFAFSAGAVEILFGVFFVLGLVTRTTTLVLAVFLITTLVLLGPLELIGHLPHFSIAIVLLVLGSGNKLKV